MVTEAQNAGSSTPSSPASINHTSMAGVPNVDGPAGDPPSAQTGDVDRIDTTPTETVTDSTPSKDATSHPMTTTSSTSSNQPQKDATMSLGPSPYGTRSRNRPGITRPNYAEDNDVDFELSAAQANGTSKKRTVSSERISHSPSAVDSGESSAVVGRRKSSVAGGSFTSGLASSTKPTEIPGLSSFSAVPNGDAAPSVSKKRKAAHSQGSVSGHSSSTPTTSHTITRQAANAVATTAPRVTNMLTFEKSKAFLRDGKLEADDGTTLSVNDHVYLVCEPPGEPYYLCRIMEFIHSDTENQGSAIDCIRVNWYYRPRDVLRYNNDTRLVYGTMHSDVCPITSLRGKCQIMHRSDIEDLDEYRKNRDSFWFNQIFDRFIHRWYEVIPTSQIINVPEKVKKALDDRWKFIVVETSRVKELTSAVKLCKRCSGYCATNESVECAVCHTTYHMNCVRPPLLKKPSRGFAWACAICSRAQERKLEARHTPIIGDTLMDVEEEEEEFFEEEEEAGSTAVVTTAPSPSGSNAQDDHHSGTQAEIALAKMWPMRYLGIHCRVEDALQYDDRAIYPRASSRLGPRHQAIVNDWCGRPVELVKPIDIKKKYVKSGSSKKDTKLSKETIAALEADRAEKARRPIWVQDEPLGYVRRGEDLDPDDPETTATVLFKMPPAGVHSFGGGDDAVSASEKAIDSYMARAKAVAEGIGVKEYCTNFLDKAIKLLVDNGYDSDAAIKQLRRVDRRKDLHEPELTKEELKRFEEGVAKYGSEMRNVRINVKTLSHADTIRFYYLWKKTPKGQEIWGAYEGRKGTKKRFEADAAAKLLDDIADNYDDSAFDNDKAVQRKRGFQCKFCSIKKSRQWRRAPGVTPGQTAPAERKGSNKDKNGNLVLALCLRCAGLWRRYAIKWENYDEVAKKVAQGGSKAWKKKMDEEYLQELMAANDAASFGAVNGDLNAHLTNPAASSVEPPRKKIKGAADKENGTALVAAAESAPKKKEKPAPPPRPPTPPIVPTLPTFRDLPCAVCHGVEVLSDQLIACKDCKLTVHRSCYGVGEQRNYSKWVCDMCMNDRVPQVSMDYKCVLCPVTSTDQDLLEPPKPLHRKKTDRDREKEKLEGELATNFLRAYAQKQREKGRPEKPREALKRTVNNNWVHVTCAVWTPEIRFSDAAALQVAEGISRGTIPASRYDQICQLCKTDHGACVSCHQCHAPFHVTCAHAAGYVFGFDITPVKVSRRDHVSMVTLGAEIGAMTAAIWCKEHSVKTIIHSVTEIEEASGLTALQLYARCFKQADLTFTGTVRKANLLNLSTRAVGPIAAQTSNNRRTSAGNGSGQTRNGRTSSIGTISHVVDQDGGLYQSAAHDSLDRRCVHCDVDVSPKWWKVGQPKPIKMEADGQFPQYPDATMVNGLDHQDKPRTSPLPPVDKMRLSQQQIVSADAQMEKVPGSAPAVQEPTTINGYSAAEKEAYQCHKCHWNEFNPPNTPEKPAPREILPPVMSPTRSLPQLSWPAPTNNLQSQAAIPTWTGPHIPITNGIPPAAQIPPHIPVHQNFHAPLHSHSHSHSGYNPHSSSAVLVQPQSVRPPPYVPPHHPPPPLPLSNPSPAASGLPNGMSSTHLPLHSPNRTGVTLPPTRSSDGPFPPLQHPVGQYAGRHASPGALLNSPQTPREAPAVPVAENRIVGGASASPSLRNLLH